MAFCVTYVDVVYVLTGGVVNVGFFQHLCASHFSLPLLMESGENQLSLRNE